MGIATPSARAEPLRLVLRAEIGPSASPNPAEVGERVGTPTPASAMSGVGPASGGTHKGD